MFFDEAGQSKYMIIRVSNAVPTTPEEECVSLTESIRRMSFDMFDVNDFFYDVATPLDIHFEVE